jgi:hypothetical protein
LIYRYESNPVQSNINAQFSEEDVIPSAGHAKNLKSKFLQLEQDANKIETSSAKMNYVPKKFTSYSSSVPVEKTEKPLENQPKPTPTKMGSGGNSQATSGEKCCVCDKTVYVMEKLEADKKIYHKLCFKCTSCHCTLK